MMKRVVMVSAMLMFPLAAFGQQQSLASTMDVYVFPGAGQEATQQSQDEKACYDWAVTNSGNDPFDLANQEQANQQQSQQEMANAQKPREGKKCF